MKRCKICDASFRKGTLAFVMGGKGLEGRIVCPECARAGVLLVAKRERPPQPTRERVMSPDVAKVIRILRTFAKQATNASQVEPSDHEQSNYQIGRAEGFEGAIEVIKRELKA